MLQRWSPRFRHSIFSSAAIALGVCAGTLLSGVQAQEPPSDTLISLEVAAPPALPTEWEQSLRNLQTELGEVAVDPIRYTDTCAEIEEEIALSQTVTHESDIQYYAIHLPGLRRYLEECFARPDTIENPRAPFPSPVGILDTVIQSLEAKDQFCRNMDYAANLSSNLSVLNPPARRGRTRYYAPPVPAPVSFEECMMRQLPQALYGLTVTGIEYGDDPWSPEGTHRTIRNPESEGPRLAVLSIPEVRRLFAPLFQSEAVASGVVSWALPRLQNLAARLAPETRRVLKQYLGSFKDYALSLEGETLVQETRYAQNGRSRFVSCRANQRGGDCYRTAPFRRVEAFLYRRIVSGHYSREFAAAQLQRLMDVL
jgi:hypothetical protein